MGMNVANNSGGGCKYFLFSALFGEDSHFDQYFSIGLKPPTRIWLNLPCNAKDIFAPLAAGAQFNFRPVDDATFPAMVRKRRPQRYQRIALVDLECR